ncbi:MAG: hypothetical protein Q7U74_06670 [Saprospiraceae bacterium]|nr:hypothetical protein [Saprospiraceae bacterium]
MGKIKEMSRNDPFFKPVQDDEGAARLNISASRLSIGVEVVQPDALITWFYSVNVTTPHEHPVGLGVTGQGLEIPADRVVS